MMSTVRIPRPSRPAKLASHMLTFRLPTDYAACLLCLKLLRVEELGTACPGAGTAARSGREETVKP